MRNWPNGRSSTRSWPDPARAGCVKIVDATGHSIGPSATGTMSGRGSIYEIGWLVVPEAQGRGVASTPISLALARAKDDGKHR